MLWEGCRAQVATFRPPVLLDNEVPPGFVQKARAGETTFSGDSAVGGFAFKKASKHHLEKCQTAVGSSSTLVCSPEEGWAGWQSSSCPMGAAPGSHQPLCRGGTGCPAVSEGEVVSFGKHSALMESGRAMYDPEADFWEQGAMFLLGKSCSHRSAEAGAR